MNRNPVELRKDDVRIWEEDLNEFVPQKIYDCHIHMFDKKYVNKQYHSHLHFGDADHETLRIWSNKLFPGRESHYLVLGCPHLGTDVKQHNEMIQRELKGDPLSRANRLTTPECNPLDIENDIKNNGFMGLKVYRIYSVTGDPNECRIKDFLPEAQLEVANDLGCWVTLHMAKQLGGGDPENLADLENYTRKYPNIKWILAHCARSFTYYQIKQGIERLRAMPNIWYDLSAVCDVTVFYTLFTKENHKRIFFGTDGIDSTNFHGSYFPMGRAWKMLDVSDWGADQFGHTEFTPIVAIYEQLLAMKHAAEMAGFSKDQIEDIFWRNAVREFGIDW